MRLNIVYSADDNYCKFAGISMISLFENNKDIKEICIYFIENNISFENKDKIKRIVMKYGRSIVFIKNSQLCERLETDNTFSVSSFSRLFLSQIKKIDKVIYLDCDTIINGSLTDIYEISDSYYLAGVQDNAGKFYRESIGCSKERYINAGVLLINLKKWREDEIEEKFIEFIKYFDGSVPHHDQGVINGVCKGKIKILSPEYNLMPPMILQNSKQISIYHNIEEYYNQYQLDNAKRNPVIIHFTESFYNRPWRKGCTHPYKHLFEKYKSLSLWAEDLQEIKDISIQEKFKVFLFKYFPISTIVLIRRIKRGWSK